MCERSHLDVQLRCDLSARTCVVAARCESCRTTYRVEPDSFALAQKEPSVLVLSCDARSRSCSLQLAC